MGTPTAIDLFCWEFYDLTFEFETYYTTNIKLLIIASLGKVCGLFAYDEYARTSELPVKVQDKIQPTESVKKGKKKIKIKITRNIGKSKRKTDKSKTKKKSDKKKPKSPKKVSKK